MKFRYVSDSHIHTDCSRDAADPATMICDRAAKLGLYSVTITDHCECNRYLADGYDKSICQSIFEAHKASAIFQGKLHVHSGVEVGQPLQEPSAAADLFERCEFDFVLASVHNVRGKEDFFDLDYTKENLEEVLERYFDELLQTIEWGGFDSLAHLTYPWRYIVGEHGIPIDDKRWEKRIDEVLKLLIEKGKALEVNTSGLRQRLGVSMPDLPVLRRYRELGGSLVTIGSDAHRWADVGAGIERGLELLQKAGFGHFAIYVSRQPKILPIA